MPSLSELPDKLNRDKLAKALMGLGFKISYKGGKGSHVKATCAKTQKAVILPSKMNKNVFYYVVKEIEKISDITWDDIKERL